MKEIFILGKRSLSLLTSVIVLGFFSSCKNEDDPYESVTVQFQTQSTSGVKYKAVVTQVGTQQSTNFNVTGNSWQSEPQIINTSVGAVHLAATADGVDANSQLILRILVNGQIKATDTVQGVALTGKVMHDFLK